MAEQMEWFVNKPNSVKILVVDDQPLIVEELCEFLESSGYRCVPCDSSLEAIELFRADPDIGLVLSDLHMPDMDGIELIQRCSGWPASSGCSRRSCSPGALTSRM